LSNTRNYSVPNRRFSKKISDKSEKCKLQTAVQKSQAIRHSHPWITLHVQYGAWYCHPIQ